ncbi:MAG: thioredoxin domain-containing protein [Candidatus Aceula meridiana]|nr:thioredoxin domain-containing protein [Candidatus Aceula meridiana]
MKVERIKRAIVWIGFFLLLLILITLRIREYKTNYLLQSRVVHKLQAIENKQDKILRALRNIKSAPAPRQEAKRPQPPQEDLNKVYTIDLSGASVKGDPDAKVTIVEFSDIQCPFSGRFHPIFQEAIKAYPKGVKYVFKNFPLSFHKQAKPAAKALLAAKEQGKYWEMFGLLMQNGKQLSEERFKELAKQLNLNMDLFSRDLANKDAEFESIIQKDMELGSSVSVRGTPTFFINGKKTRARTVEEIKKEIDTILNAK